MKSLETNSSTSWTFLSNHGHVFLCIASEAELTVRELAVRVGITERAVHRILSELEESGYVVREREGRRNRYIVDLSLPMRHPVEAHQKVAVLAELINSASPISKKLVPVRKTDNAPPVRRSRRSKG